MLIVTLFLLLSTNLVKSAPYRKLTCYTKDQMQPGQNMIRMDCYIENNASSDVILLTTQPSPTTSPTSPPGPLPPTRNQYNCQKGLDLLIAKSKERFELDCGRSEERGRILTHLEMSGIVGCSMAADNVIYCKCQTVSECQPSKSPSSVTLIQLNHRLNL